MAAPPSLSARRDRTSQEARQGPGPFPEIDEGKIPAVALLSLQPGPALAATSTSWLEPIARMGRFSQSNGITEGFHTKMEMLSRRAYGFRNFENYRLRVLAQCGWNGVINRV
ncbi:transposase [Castellaniella sp. UC4442_H9]